MAKPIQNAEEAIARANKLTGLDALFPKPTPEEPNVPMPTAELIRMRQDDTPYLGERNHGKAVWRVSYPPALLQFPSAAKNARDSFERNFTAWLDAQTGVLYYIVSEYTGERDPDLYPMPNCGEATAQLSGEAEVYDGYPELDPLVTFLAALESVLNGGVSSPFLAKTIHASLVMHSRMAEEPKPRWAISMMGIPPLKARGPAGDKVPVWQRNHIRNVVDANTGLPVFATNSPQPVVVA